LIDRFNYLAQRASNVRNKLRSEQMDRLFETFATDIAGSRIADETIAHRRTAIQRAGDDSSNDRVPIIDRSIDSSLIGHEKRREWRNFREGRYIFRRHGGRLGGRFNRWR